ncbi:MAG: helix-turn-helix domain-containing protein [Mycobacterium sp.]
MGYREIAPPADLGSFVETAWMADGGGEPVRVLPDGCMDLIRMDGEVIVAGPDTRALITAHGRRPAAGLRFRPGALPRLLGVPAAELVGERIALDALCTVNSRAPLEVIAAELASRPWRRETSPWSPQTLESLTAALAVGTPVGQLARETGWSSRTLQRQCRAVYGYGPTTLRRILRFRRAVSRIRAGQSLADVAVATGYADQSHLHREVREFAGVTASALTAYVDGANRSTEVPSGSSTVA